MNKSGDLGGDAIEVAFNDPQLKGWKQLTRLFLMPGERASIACLLERDGSLFSPRNYRLVYINVFDTSGRIVRFPTADGGTTDIFPSPLLFEDPAATRNDTISKLIAGLEEALGESLATDMARAEAQAQQFADPDVQRLVSWLAPMVAFVRDDKARAGNDAAEVLSMLELAYAGGWMVREIQLKQAYESAAELGLRRRKGGRPGGISRGEDISEAALKWHERAKPWAQDLINARPVTARPISWEKVAEKMIEEWPARPFAADADPAARGPSSPPTVNYLATKVVNRWELVRPTLKSR